jgi:very-short-patch-repair endonuclease
MQAGKAKKKFAQQLRKESTDAEQILWFRLRDRRLARSKFRRQYPIGTYVVDFASYKDRLIIELDGSQHAAQKDYDARRAAWLVKQGYRVLRFPDNVVLKETDMVLEVIWRAVAQASPETGEKTPHPAAPPSLARREG